MHFSTQQSAALAVALLSTYSAASGVKAAPIPKVSVGHVANGVGITSDIAQGVGAFVQRREPEPKKLPSLKLPSLREVLENVSI